MGRELSLGCMVLWNVTRLIENHESKYIVIFGINWMPGNKNQGQWISWPSNRYDEKLKIDVSKIIS